MLQKTWSKMTTLVYATCFMVLPSYALVEAQAPVAQDLSYDCTGVEVAQLETALLTKEEQLARLDGALIDSIDRYSSCISAKQEEMAGGGAGKAGGVSGQIDASNEGTSSELEADESTQSRNTSSPIDIDETQKQVPTSPSNGSDKARRGVVKPKDNDAIICTILYEAIANESDETTRIGLEQQYADYQCGK